MLRTLRLARIFASHLSPLQRSLVGSKVHDISISKRVTAEMISRWRNRTRFSPIFMFSTVFFLTESMQSGWHLRLVDDTHPASSNGFPGPSSINRVTKSLTTKQSTRFLETCIETARNTGAHRPASHPVVSTTNPNYKVIMHRARTYLA